MNIYDACSAAPCLGHTASAFLANNNEQSNVNPMNPSRRVAGGSYTVVLLGLGNIFLVKDALLRYPNTLTYEQQNQINVCLREICQYDMAMCPASTHHDRNGSS